MSLVNYYQVLEVAPTADDETIKVAIRKQRREWRTRAAHPNAETRALAERMMQYVSDAERVLLNAAKRSDFDRQLAAHVETQPEDIAGPGGRDWVSLIRDHLAGGNFSAANYAARKATSEQPNFAEAWYLQGISSGMLGHVGDAEFEFGEAIRLDPKNAAYYGELAQLYVGEEQWGRAQENFRRANDLEPNNDFYRVGIAAMHVAQERPDLALPILEEAVKKNPENATYKMQLAVALIDYAESRFSKLGDGSLAILNSAQLELAESTVSRVRALNIKDHELNVEINVWSRAVADAERVLWAHPDNLTIFVVAFVASVIALFLIGVSTLVGVIGLIGVIAIPVFYVKYFRVPGYVREARQATKFERQTGIQPVKELA